MNRVRQPTVSIRDMVRVRGGRCKAPIPKPVTGRRRREVDEEVDEAPVVKRPRGRPARASKVSEPAFPMNLANAECSSSLVAPGPSHPSYLAE